MSEDDEAVHCIVTLVHGTFGEGASWMSERSKIRTSIAEAVGERIRFRVFSWSGKNTNRARLIAGRDLATSIEEAQAHHPRAQQFIIAHSHGGNVAAYALRDVVPPKPVVTTLATPFLHAEARDTEGQLELLAPALTIMVRMCALLVMFLAPALFFRRELGDGFGLAIWIGVWVVVGHVLASRIRRWLFESVLPLIWTRQAQLCDTLAAVFEPDTSLLAIYPRRDEARHALRAVDQLGELPHRLMRAVGIVSGVATTVASGWIYIRVTLDVVPPVFARLIGVACFFILLVPVAYTLLQVPLLLTNLVRRLGYWDDSPFDYCHTRLFVAASPPWDRGRLVSRSGGEGPLGSSKGMCI